MTDTEFALSGCFNWSDKMTYLNIEVIPKEQKAENDTIKIKWQKPKIDSEIRQQ